MSAKESDAKLMATLLDGVGALLSPLRMIGADGGLGGCGVAKGVFVSQSHSERLSGRRASPSHDAGPLDQTTQPPSCQAITQTIDNRRHIF